MWTWSDRLVMLRTEINYRFPGRYPFNKVVPGTCSRKRRAGKECIWAVFFEVGLKEEMMI